MDAKASFVLVVRRLGVVTVLDQERQLLQLNRQIDSHQAYCWGQAQHNWCKVQDAAYVRGCQHIGNALRNISRNRKNSQFRTEFDRPFCKRIRRLNREVLDHLTDLPGVRVEQADNLESLRAEALVAEKCSGEVPHANQNGTPGSVDTESRPNRGGEFLRLVANPPLTKVAKCRQVAPYLRVAHADRARDPPTGDLTAIGRPVRDTPQV